MIAKVTVAERRGVIAGVAQPTKTALFSLKLNYEEQEYAERFVAEASLLGESSATNGPKRNGVLFSGNNVLRSPYRARFLRAKLPSFQRFLVKRR